MTYTTLLPLIASGPTPPVGMGGQSVAEQLFDLMRNHPEQRRSVCAWNAKIAEVAEHRVFSMAHDGWFGHVDPQGFGPNHWLRGIGYKLPDFYGKEPGANNVESIECGRNQHANVIWDTWMNSPSHRVHILGTLDFYKAQTQIGIAAIYVEDSPQGGYYAIISVPQEAA